MSVEKKSSGKLIDTNQGTKIRKVVQKMKRLMLCITVFTLLLTSAAFAASFNGTVVSVIDGNTIVVERDSRLVKVRFVGIGCPELGQDYGLQAKQFVTDLLMGKEVNVDKVTTDYDNRVISKVTVGGRDVALEVASAGLAWYDSKFQRQPKIAAAVEQMKAKKAGLWSKANPVSPWAYRQQKSGVRAIMSTDVCSIGAGGYGFAANPVAGNFKDATTPPGGWCGGICEAPASGMLPGSPPAFAPLESKPPASVEPPGSSSPTSTNTFSRGF